ncbi:MAG: TIGR03943 family protein [Firmicutes bacterium]|jgi:putative membrane protein|nr:TIGR03943 family protein [Bacillota bacterium]
MKRLNINKLIWIVILLSFITLIINLIISRELLMFVHPKMTKYVVFSLIMLIILAYIEIKYIFQIENTNGIKPGLLIFIITLIFAFNANPHKINPNEISSKSSSINKSFTNSISSINKSIDKEKILSDNTPDNTYLSKEKDSLKDINDSEINLDTIEDSEIIEINDENYLELLQDIHADMEYYKGKQIHTRGFVFREKNMSTKEFVISRLVMVCCAADAQLTGLVCDYDEGNTLEDNTWIDVFGKIEIFEYNDPNTGEKYPLPKIVVIEQKNITKPENPYIFP